MQLSSHPDLLSGALAFSNVTQSSESIGDPAAIRFLERREEVDTVRNHLWIFTTVAGGVDDYLEQGGIRGGSRMTPAEGAFYLGVPNLILVRHQGFPASPKYQQGWRSRSSFEQYALSFRPLKRVVWSIVGSGGSMEGDELRWILELAEHFPNIQGVYLDDFFVTKGGKVTGALSPEELGALRNGLVVSGRRLEMWLTLYTNQLDPSQPRNVDIPVPEELRSYLEFFDVVTLWTWSSDELEGLEQNFERLEKLASSPHKALGCYLWDFYNKRPVSLSLMEKQCNAGLRWLKEGKVTAIVFLGNNVLDVGLEVAEWTREWIEKVRDDRLL